MMDGVLSNQARVRGWDILFSSNSCDYALLLCVFAGLLRFCCAFCSSMFSGGSSRERSILCINNFWKGFSSKIREENDLVESKNGVGWHSFPLSRKVSSSPCPSTRLFTQ